MRTSYISNNLNGDHGLYGRAKMGLESLVLLAVVSAGITGPTLIGVTVGAIVGAIQIGVAVGLSYLASSFNKPQAPKPQDIQTSIKNPVAPRVRHYGRVKTSGPWVFVDSKQGGLYKVIALGTGLLDAIEEYWIDDNLVTLDGTGNVTSAPYNGSAYIYSRLGLATETPYNLSLAFPEWDSSHRGDGVSSLYASQSPVSSDQITQVFPNITNTLYRVVARGSIVYSLGPATVIWSDNAADIMRDYLIHPDGMRLPQSVVNAPLVTCRVAGCLCAVR